MHRYTISKRLGDGSFGEVVKAVCKQSGEASRDRRLYHFANTLSPIFVSLMHCITGGGNQTDEKKILQLG